jgi:hypothetical protein
MARTTILISNRAMYYLAFLLRLMRQSKQVLAWVPGRPRVSSGRDLADAVVCLMKFTKPCQSMWEQATTFRLLRGRIMSGGWKGQPSVRSEQSDGPPRKFRNVGFAARSQMAGTRTVLDIDPLSSLKDPICDRCGEHLPSLQVRRLDWTRLVFYGGLGSCYPGCEADTAAPFLRLPGYSL